MPSPLVSRDARELGLLAGHHDEAFAVFDDDAEAVEQPFGEQAPFAADDAPEAGAARGDDDGAVLRDGEAQRFEQLIAAVVVLRRVVVLDAVARGQLRGGRALTSGARLYA